MSEKPRTQEEVRKEKYWHRVKEIKALGDLALQEIDEALAGNALIVDFPERPDPNPPDICA